jgi:hypothetical protein
LILFGYFPHHPARLIQAALVTSVGSQAEANLRLNPFWLRAKMANMIEVPPTLWRARSAELIAMLIKNQEEDHG